MLLPSSFTSTPAGIGIGWLPMRDTTATSLRPLPNVADYFSADALLTGLSVAHDPLRRGHDRHAEPSQHPRDLILARVYPAPGLADALQPRNDSLPIRAV